jgi:hypothetical protein
LPSAGFEPARLSALVPKTRMSTSSITKAFNLNYNTKIENFSNIKITYIITEREGFEPSVRKTYSDVPDPYLKPLGHLSKFVFLKK